MSFLADTVALVRHLRGGKRLGARAKKILQDADAGLHTIYISGVTLMEILYLSESCRIPVDEKNVQNLLARSRNYRVIPIGMEVVASALTMFLSCTTGSSPPPPSCWQCRSSLMIR
jgi:predicted nucleic acid-binding protein